MTGTCHAAEKVDEAVNEQKDLLAALHEARLDVVHHHGEPGLSRDLSDARAHRARPDHANALDLAGGHVQRCYHGPP